MNELECPMCPFKPKESLTPEESRNAIRKHTILEHFKAKIPPALIKGPDEYKYENNIDESSRVLDIAPKCVLTSFRPVNFLLAVQSPQGIFF